MHGLDFLENENDEIRNEFLRNSIPLKRVNSDKTINTYGTQMVEFCRLSNLSILNGRIGRNTQNAKYTCKDKSVIDYFLCSPTLFSLLHDFCILEFSNLFSDAHCPIALTLRIQSQNLNEKEFVSNDIRNIKLWNPDKSSCFIEHYNTEKMSEIDSQISLLLEKGSPLQSEVDEIVTQIGQTFEKCAEESFGYSKQGQTKPTNNKNNVKKPWFKENCFRARNQYHKARRRYNINKSEHNKQILKQTSKYYKSTMNLSIKQFKSLRIQKLRNIRSTNPREYWKILNSSNPKSECQAPLQDLYEYFKNVNGCQESTQHNNASNVKNKENAHLNRQISESEVRVAINQLKNNKSAGIDNIKNEHIKSTSCQMIPTYTKLFNLVFDTAIIPECWSVGVIKPIYKKGDPELPQNYRPITILSCLGKLFTSVINNRLKEYAEQVELIESCQAGLRKNHSTADNIFIIKSLIDIAKANKSKLFGCFIDFKQAFDTVWRTGLWQKLGNNEINGKCLNVIQSIYKNVKSKVVTHEGATMFFPCLTGVRQGENLSPFLFSIFVNDLNHFMMSKNLQGSTCEFNSEEIYIYLKIMLLLYADDTVLFSNTENDMQLALDNFHSYCTNWRLTVNIEKTKIIVFSGGKPKSYTFKLNGSDLEVTNEYKYLGIVFTRGGSFIKAKQHIAEQANKALFALLKKIRALSLPFDIQLELFDKTIKPILLYGAEVWGFGNCDLLDRVQLRFLKYIFKLKKSTPSHMIYGELGIFPITVDIRHRALTYWSKLIANSSADTLGTQKLSTYIYSLMYNMHKHRRLKSQWLDNIKNLLCNLGFSGIWDSQIVENNKWLSATLKRKLQDQYIQNWSTLSNTASSSKNYRLWKTNFERSSFLKLLPDYLSQKMLAFRTRNHRLPVETGRWFGIPLQERKCQYCNNDIGDEFHYILNCNSFLEERKTYIKRYYFTRPNIIKYNELMNTTNIDMLKKLAKFICIIMKTVRN